MFFVHLHRHISLPAKLCIVDNVGPIKNFGHGKMRFEHISTPAIYEFRRWKNRMVPVA